MNYSKKIISHLILIFCAVISFTACNEVAWENHIDSKKNDMSLLQLVASRPELTTYHKMLKKSGYDQLLETPNGYTVFAPENSSWIGIDTTDTESITKLIGMTISYQTYFSDNNQLFKPIKMVNGKYLVYDVNTNSFNGVSLLTKDVAAKNGVLHTVDKMIDRKDNIWEYLSLKTDFKQYQFIKTLNTRVMDVVKSVEIGVYPDGKTKYDTVWNNINNFLDAYPLDNEDSVYTYIIVKNEGFDLLYNKYRSYFKSTTDFKTDSLTRFNICQDFVFKGKIDLENADTLVNIDGVKVPVKGSVVLESYNASNGKVYIIDQSNIRLKEKIKPIKIEGEDYVGVSNALYLFTRYKLWASGKHDIALASAETQSDTIWRKDMSVRDSVVSKTYSLNSSVIANIVNFHVEFQPKVHSANYDIYYVAYDDIQTHFDPSYKTFGAYRVTQKLFVSMPDAKKLFKGTTNTTAEVQNNYLGNTMCFAGVTKAGVHELTKLTKWNLTTTSQTLSSKDISSDAGIMVVPRAGKMTMWLCNSAINITSSNQGLMFLDYILLVPRINE